tara:strand:- start:1192 stop:1413 length:222 start_codon:yes stop_codon:yes gene_type:complete
VNIGDLVKRKPKWGDWVKHNPWMHTEKDFEIGVIVEKVDIPGTRHNQVFRVLWPDGISDSIWDRDLEVVNESR